MVYTPRFFPLQNAVCFIIITYLVPVLFTFYIQNVLKKNNSGTKRLKTKNFSITSSQTSKRAQLSRFPGFPPFRPSGRNNTWIKTSVEHWCNGSDWERAKNMGGVKVCRSATTLNTRKLTRTVLGSKRSPQGERLATNRLSHGTAFNLLAPELFFFNFSTSCT